MNLRPSFLRKLNALGAGSTKYFKKILKPGTEGWQRMEQLLNVYGKGKEITISEAIAVYNPLLVSNFISSWYAIHEHILI